MNPNFRGKGGGARVSEFFYKESKSKKNKKNFGGGLGGGGRGRFTDRGHAQTNLLLQLLRSWEHNNE